MTKPEAYSVQQEEHDHEEGDRRTTQEPLSGSKKVKNRNHSRQNHGEGRWSGSSKFNQTFVFTSYPNVWV